MKIQIIGAGFVGRATHNMLEGHQVVIYDPMKGFNDLDKTTIAAFICVPTATIGGKRDHSIIESVLNVL